MTRHSEKEKLHISHLLTYVYTMLLLLSILGLRIATYTKIKIIMHVKKNLAEERREWKYGLLKNTAYLTPGI